MAHSFSRTVPNRPVRDANRDEALIASGQHPMGDAVSFVLDGVKAIHNMDGAHKDLAEATLAVYRSWIAAHVDTIPGAYAWPLLCEVYGLKGLRDALARSAPVPTALLDSAAALFHAPPLSWKLYACVFDLSLPEADALFGRGLSLADMLSAKRGMFGYEQALVHALTVEGSWLLDRWPGRTSVAKLWFRSRGKLVLPEAPLSTRGAALMADTLAKMFTASPSPKADADLLTLDFVDPRCWGAVIQIAHAHGSLALHRKMPRRLTYSDVYVDTPLHSDWLFDDSSAHRAMQRAERLRQARGPVEMLRIPSTTRRLHDADVLFAPRPTGARK